MCCIQIAYKNGTLRCVVLKVAHRNMLKIAHHFSLCIHREKWCAISSAFTCAISMSPVLAQFTCVILFSVLSNPIAPIKILSNH